VSSFIRVARRVLVLIVGIALMLAGAAMLVLPGPGLVVLFGGLALLATEFTWAERLLNWAKTRGLTIYRQIRNRIRHWRGRDRPDPALAPTPDQLVLQNRPYSDRIAVAGSPNGWSTGSAQAIEREAPAPDAEQPVAPPARDSERPPEPQPDPRVLPEPR
jgi:hypothetical protein